VFVEPVFVEPVFVEPVFVEPVFVDPVFVEAVVFMVFGISFSYSDPAVRTTPNYVYDQLRAKRP
jgi:hypothetical protein